MPRERFQLVDATFHCQSADGQATAHGQMEGLEVFCVLAGSTAKGHPNWVVQEQLVKNGVLKRRGEIFVFLKDFPFQEPSPAASAVLGRSANGWEEWKTDNGQTLGQLAGRGP